MCYHMFAKHEGNMGDTVHGNKYEQSGDFRGSQNFYDSTVNVELPAGAPYNPPPYPTPGELPAPDRLPPGSFLPLPPNPLFTGRGEDLLALAALLRPDGPATGPIVIASGIGGVGKTQLAVEFAYRYGRFFHGVHWLSAENPDALDSAIAECGRRMALHPTFGNLSLPDQVALTERAWAGPEARLIVFDNCEEPRALARRPAGGGARLLITSRRERWDGELGGPVRPVRPLPPPESVRLLRRHLTEGDGRPPRADIDDAALGRIAAALGELPLALRLAGAYLRRYKRETAAAYLAALGRADVLEHDSLRQEGESDTTGHSLNVWKTFAVSFNKLRPADPTDAAARSLLAVAACFAPGEPLPEALLLAAGERAAAGGGEPPPARRLDDGLERLLELGLLEGAGADAVRLHRLLARFAAKALAPIVADVASAVAEATAGLAERAKETGNLWLINSWILQLRYITDRHLDREDRTSARLCNVFADWLQLTGDIPNSVRYTDRALHVCKAYLGEEDIVYTETLNNKGFLLQAQGDLAGARPYYERALAIRERILGPEHPDTATSLNNLGSLLRAQGDLAGARPYYERALAISELVLGPEHPDTATSLNNLGFLLQAQGDLAGARPYVERALAIFERILGSEHPNMATLNNNLGGLLYAQGDLAGARPYFERALAIRERVLGPEHPDTAQSLNNLGGLLQAQGDLAGARPYYERALAIRERVLGPEHPDTAQSLNNLGFLLQAQGDLAGAQPYLERALAILERVLGPEHPDTATSLNNLGFLLRAQGDLAGARPYYERALAIRERVLGPEHPDTAISYVNVGALLAELGEKEKARALLERAAAVFLARLGPDHQYTRIALGHLASLR